MMIVLCHVQHEHWACTLIKTSQPILIWKTINVRNTIHWGKSHVAWAVLDKISFVIVVVDIFCNPIQNEYFFKVLRSSILLFVSLLYQFHASHIIRLCEFKLTPDLKWYKWISSKNIFLLLLLLYFIYHIYYR